MKPTAPKNLQTTDLGHKTYKGLADRTGEVISKLSEVAGTYLAALSTEQIQILCDPQKAAMDRELRELREKVALLEKQGKRA